MNGMPFRPPLGAAGIAAALTVGFIAFAAKGPPRPLPATAVDSVFSADRAMRHVRAMSERPHPPGSADHARVRDYLVAELAALGVEPMIQRTTAVGTRFQEAGRVENVMARLPGTKPGGTAILLAAHYDGVGAAAFVAEHPWAKDVEVSLNFEARGTGGTAVMFQTGPGNLDQIRLLRRPPDIAASSVAVTVYRYLPNDTDWSEFFALGTPALNFAFADGVERYHTAEDDAGHLDPGSIQQEGAAALGLTRGFGHGPLPRPTTGNAVFFELPVVGLVVYPESGARPIGVGSILLTHGTERPRLVKWERRAPVRVHGLASLFGRYQQTAPLWAHYELKPRGEARGILGSDLDTDIVFAGGQVIARKCRRNQGRRRCDPTARHRLVLEGESDIEPPTLRPDIDRLRPRCPEGIINIGPMKGEELSGVPVCSGKPELRKGHASLDGLTAPVANLQSEHLWIRDTGPRRSHIPRFGVESKGTSRNCGLLRKAWTNPPNLASNVAAPTWLSMIGSAK